MVTSVAPQVIVLNGTSSAGKSSIAKALQRILPELWLHVSVDGFLSFLPLGERDTEIAAEFPTVARGIHAAMGALAREGNHIIIDHVLSLPGSAEQLRTALSGIPTLWVAVDCAVDILEAREAGRGDRKAGAARSQLEAAHMGVTYDLRVDTTNLDAQSCAQTVAARVRSSV